MSAVPVVSVGLVDRLRRLAAGTTLPLPGHGDTPARHNALLEIGRRDLSLARVFEAHSDAVAILSECGRSAERAALYGVWASDGQKSLLTASCDRDGEWQLDGEKKYCSGSSFLTSALVTAHFRGQRLLFDVRLDRPGIRILPSNWANPALADTATASVSFNAVRLRASSLIGEDDWYLKRSGFWHGAIGPAACWAGGARSLIDAAEKLGRNGPHEKAHLGALQAIAFGLEAVLDHAGREIDADPFDAQGQACARALKTRHLIERWCTEAQDRFGRATGPELLAFDSHLIHQHAALGLYIRQCHAERDLEILAG